MKSSRYNIFIHIIACISFFLLPLLFFPNPSKSFNVFNNPPTQRDFIAQVLLIGFFYLNYFVLLPKYYLTKKYFIFSIVSFSCLLFIIFMPSLLTHHLPFQSQHFPPPNNELHKPPPDFNDQHEPLHFHDDSPFFPEISHDIFLFFVVLFFSLSLRINNRLKEVQQEKTEAELTYLKSQINPHFLFNTLNLIYSLTIQNSSQASEAVVKLANMMRYVLYDSNKKFVSVQQEINYLKNYIDLQQTRFGDSIKLIFEISGDVESTKKIAPLILIPFVENAFKHGVNAEENSEININISIKKEELQLKVYNTKVKINYIDNEGGVGISNTTNRLNLLYADKHELHIENTTTDFFVHLNLHLYD